MAYGNIIVTMPTTAAALHRDKSLRSGTRRTELSIDPRPTSYLSTSRAHTGPPQHPLQQPVHDPVWQQVQGDPPGIRLHRIGGRGVSRGEGRVHRLGDEHWGVRQSGWPSLRKPAPALRSLVRCTSCAPRRSSPSRNSPFASVRRPPSSRASKTTTTRATHWRCCVALPLRSINASRSASFH